MRRVVIRIRPDGTVVRDYQGFVGEECDIEDAKLTAKLSARGVSENVKKKEYKPEYYAVKEEETQMEEVQL